MIKEYQEFKQQHNKLFEALTDNEKKELEAFEKSLLETLQKVATLLSDPSLTSRGQ
jgi:hypothetical protein